MEFGEAKSGLFRNLLVILFFGVFILIGRFAYVVTVTGESCNRGDFCFFALPETLNFVVAGSGSGASAIVGTDAVPLDNPRRDLYTSKDWIKSVNYYSSVFQDLISDGYLSTNSRSLCVETTIGQEVFALREIGVEDSIGISKMASKPLVIPGEGHWIPFGNNSFDFIFSGSAKLEISANPAEFASEITRTLKPEGFLVAHIKSRDTYSFNSFLNLFNSFELVKFRDIDGFDSSLPYSREIVMKKKIEILEILGNGVKNLDFDNQCSVPEHKLDLIRNAEALITEEPLKPWITLKRNIQNIKYLPSMADLSFKSRYVYVDVGARSYGSSIGSWFRKQYPKQNKTFEVFAIEADKTFHDEYRSKKKITLLPYAAWIRNETLSFQVNGDSSHRGMGRIQPKTSSSGNVDRIQGFDLAEWLKKTVTEKDFVVMKMDVEGTEFDLIPRLFETGAICLIDEIFLECHYNRWQRCCPGERSPKYEKSYGQCLDLFTSLRESGVLVHQWW